MKPSVKRKFHQFDEDSLKRAVEAIRNGVNLRWGSEINSIKGKVPKRCQSTDGTRSCVNQGN